jgi:hypothetical protein
MTRVNAVVGFSQVHPGPNGEAQSCDRERQPRCLLRAGNASIDLESAETKASARRPSKKTDCLLKESCKNGLI